MTKVKTRRVTPPTRLFVVLALICWLFVCFSSCNVTRKITTESEYVQRGDTNVVIVTKTIESYDATKKFSNF